MSTAVEIEAAMGQLPLAEQVTLRDRLLERVPIKAKTGAELAALWPLCFHLAPQEADDFSRDLEAARQSPLKTLG